MEQVAKKTELYRPIVGDLTLSYEGSAQQFTIFTAEELQLQLDFHYLQMAYDLALRSEDPSTQNGAVLVHDTVIGRGWNHPPDGTTFTLEDLGTRPLKYEITEHAERDAIFNAVATGHGEFIPGSTLYCPWFACADCARAIILTGIKRVVGHQEIEAMSYAHAHADWKSCTARADARLKEKGIEVVRLEGKLNCSPIRFNGQLWTP